MYRKEQGEKITIQHDVQQAFRMSALLWVLSAQSIRDANWHQVLMQSLKRLKIYSDEDGSEQIIKFDWTEGADLCT